MATRWPQKYPDAPEHAHSCRVAGCRMCDFRSQTRETSQENEIPCSLLFRMVCSVPQPDSTLDWQEYDDLSFMNFEDDSDEKAREEHRLNEEFGVNVRDYKNINQWDEPNFDECPPSPTAREERQLRALPERCPLCNLKIVHQHVSWWRGQKGCMCHVLPGDVCWCGYCILQRKRLHPKSPEELEAERRRWDEERTKKTPSEEKLYKKALEGYEEWRFNKYFLQPTGDQSLDESINQSETVLEQTLQLETSLNASVRSLFDPNSTVRLLPLYETLPPRSGSSTVPGEVDPVSATQRSRQSLINQDITSMGNDDSITANTHRRKSQVNGELARRRRSATGENESQIESISAHTDEVRTKVIGEALQGVKTKRSCSTVKTALKNIRKMSKQYITGADSSQGEQDSLNETVIAAPAPPSSANTSHHSTANRSLNGSHHSTANQSHHSTANQSHHSAANQSHHSTANSTLDDMSILEALQAAHESIRLQTSGNVELEQAVQEASQAEQTVHELSMNGSFNPEIIHQRRRHMANLRKAAAARECASATVPIPDSPYPQDRPGILRFDTGRNAYRNILKKRVRPTNTSFPGPGPKDDQPTPPMNAWKQNTSIRSNRSVRSNTSVNSCFDPVVYHQTRRQQMNASMNASTNSVNSSSFDPAAHHTQARQLLRETLQNATQVLRQTLSTSQTALNEQTRVLKGLNTSAQGANASAQGANASRSSRSDSTASAANQSQNTLQNRSQTAANTSAKTVQGLLRPTSLAPSAPHDDSMLNESLINPPHFSRTNPHYQSHSASTPTTAQDRYLRFRTYLANNQINETIVETAQRSMTESMGNAVAGLFQNDSRNSTINDSGLRQTMNSSDAPGTQHSVRSNTSTHSTAPHSTVPHNVTGNTTINQSVLSARTPADADTTLTALDDISYMGDVAVPRDVSLHDTVRDLREALETSVLQSFYRLTPHYNSGYGDGTFGSRSRDIQANYRNPAPQGCYSRVGRGDGSGIVIEINANPTFINNPGAGSDSLLPQIEAMIAARQRDFEHYMEDMCLRKLDAHFVRPHYGSN